MAMIRPQVLQTHERRPPDLCRAGETSDGDVKRDDEMLTCSVCVDVQRLSRNEVYHGIPQNRHGDNEDDMFSGVVNLRGRDVPTSATSTAL